MRGWKRRSHFRRQDGIIFQPGAGGGMLLDSGGQAGSVGGDTTVPQQATNAGSNSPGNQNSAAGTGTLQTQLQSIASPATSTRAATTSIAISAILFAPSTFQDALSITTVSSSISDSSTLQSISSTAQSSSPSVTQSSSSSSETSTSFSSSTSLSASSIQDASSTSASLSANQSSSASASSTPVVNAVGHPTEFYAGIVFIAIVSLACLFAFAAWIIRSQRNRPAWCGGSREEDDVENQDIGFGLGLYLDKPRESFDSFLKGSSASFQDPPRSTLQGNPFTPSAFHGMTNSPGRYPTSTKRPPPVLLRSTDSVQSSNQVLGPLRIKNYVSGDFPSSCDEATLSPRRSESFARDFGTPREVGPGTMPRFLTLGGQGLNVPWAPLNLDLKSSRSPSQVTITHSPSTRSLVIHTQEEEIPPLPMPPFDYAVTMKNEELPGSDSWGATLRSSIYNALSGLAGSNSKPEDDKDKFTALPESISQSRSRTRSTRWRNALSSRKIESSDMNAEDSRASSACDAWTSPKAVDNGLFFTQAGPGMTSISSVALEVGPSTSDVRDSTVNRAPSTNSTTPLVVKKKRSTGSRTRSRLRSEWSNAKTKQSASRSSSIYSPCPDAIRPRTSNKRVSAFTSKGTSSKRGSINLIANAPQSSLVNPRPAFLRQGTADSATSFSSEASDSFRDLSDRELHAKRTMMLRARRKRGMGMGGGMGRRLTLNKQVSIRSAASTRSGPMRSNSKADDSR